MAISQGPIFPSNYKITTGNKSQLRNRKKQQITDKYIRVTKNTPEFRILSQTSTRSSGEFSGYRSSCQKLIVFKQLHLQTESCCQGRDRSEKLQNRQRIWIWFSESLVRRNSPSQTVEVASEQIKKIKRVNFRDHRNETQYAVICRVSWIQSNFPDVVSFSREVVVFGFEQKILHPAEFCQDHVTMFTEHVGTTASDWPVSGVATSSQTKDQFLLLLRSHVSGDLKFN